MTSTKPAWVAVPDDWNKTVGALCTEYIKKTEPVRGRRCDGTEVDLEPGYAGYQLNNCKLKGSGFNSLTTTSTSGMWDYSLALLNWSMIRPHPALAFIPEFSNAYFLGKKPIVAAPIENY